MQHIHQSEETNTIGKIMKFLETKFSVSITMLSAGQYVLYNGWE